jgi:arabinan endo-1,5-alpha-L-arabinosidase
MAALCAGQAVGPFPLYGDDFAHDPSTLIKDGASYFIYADGQGITALTSTDRRNWSGASPVFTTNIPAWTTNNISGFTGYFWAPDVACFNGQYNLYYVCSEWGTINSAIGLVTSPSLISPVWTDQGKVIQSNPDNETTTNTDLTAYNCIDPSIMQDTNGTIWMSFGSYSDGILIMQLNPATGKRFSSTSPIYRVSNNGPVFFSNTEEGSCLYHHDGWYYLFVNWGGCCAGVDSTYNIRVGRSQTVTGPYFDASGVNLTNGGGTMVLESNARYIGPGQAAIMNDNGTNWFTFHYYDGNNGGAPTLGLMRVNWLTNGWPALTNDWSAFYPLTTDAREHLGLYDGTLVNHAGITNDASLGKVLNLDGATNYVVLADPVANCSTLMGWVKWNGGNPWQRIFDFGSGTTNYFFLTPLSNAGTMRFAITTNSSGGEQQINAPTALPIGSWCHVAVTLNGSEGLLYLDGVPVATNSSLTIRPWQILAATNYLGKSQWPGDPLFNGRMVSFRIFGRALSGTEIQGFAHAPPALAHRYSFTNDASDSIGMAHGTLMGNATATNNTLKLTGATGGYVNLPGGLVSGCAAATIEFWAAFGANADWARVFDFGNINGAYGGQYLFFSPHDGSGDHHLEISTNAAVALAIPGALDNRTVCVTCIVDPANSYWAVYTNGILESAKTNALPPLTSLSGAWSFLGRSLFSAYPYLNAVIDEFRIYDGRLTPQQIATDFQYGPGALALPVTLAQTNAPAGWTLSWPSWAVGFAAEGSPDLLNWTTNGLTPGLTNDLWSLTVPKTNAVKFYRLQR